MGKKRNKKKTKFISTMVHKGGVFKTSIIINVAGSLSRKGKKSLIINFDTQGHIGFAFGVNSLEIDNTIDDLMLGDCELEDCVYPLSDNIDTIHGNINIAYLESQIIEKTRKNEIQNPDLILKEIKDKIIALDEYDYVFFDVSSEMGFLTLNIINAIDEIIMPLQCDPFGVDSVIKTLNTIDGIVKNNDIDIKISGILPIRYKRTNEVKNNINLMNLLLSNENVKFKFKKPKILNTKIPSSVKFSEYISSDRLPLTLINAEDIKVKREREKVIELQNIYNSLIKEIELI